MKSHLRDAIIIVNGATNTANRTNRKHQTSPPTDVPLKILRRGCFADTITKLLARDCGVRVRYCLSWDMAELGCSRRPQHDRVKSTSSTLVSPWKSPSQFQRKTQLVELTWYHHSSAFGVAGVSVKVPSEARTGGATVLLYDQMQGPTVLAGTTPATHSNLYTILTFPDMHMIIPRPRTAPINPHGV